MNEKYFIKIGLDLNYIVKESWCYLRDVDIKNKLIW